MRRLNAIIYTHPFPHSRNRDGFRIESLVAAAAARVTVTDAAVAGGKAVAGAAAGNPVAMAAVLSCPAPLARVRISTASLPAVTAVAAGGLIDGLAGAGIGPTLRNGTGRVLKAKTHRIWVDAFGDGHDAEVAAEIPGLDARGAVLGGSKAEGGDDGDDGGLHFEFVEDGFVRSWCKCDWKCVCGRILLIYCASESA
jgi:hypothetical protein